MHWSENWIGKPYRLGDADCAAMCLDVIEQEFEGRLPDFCKAIRDNTRLQRARQLEELAKAATERTDDPQEGDVVLMMCKARPSHVGIYCVVDGEPCVLHSMENAKMVVRHRIRDLPKYFLAVEGYYKWNRPNSANR